jgi:hypothetical protein
LGRISASSSPGISYSPDPHHVPALSSQALSLPLSPPPGNYNYRIVTPNYHDQSLANSCPTFVNNPTGPSQNASHNTIGSNNFTYSHSDYGGHSQQSSRSASPSTAMHSRHSLSNIDNSRYPSSHAPPSPASGSSHTSHSAPPTPTYPISYASTNSYSHSRREIATSHPTVPHNNQLHSQSYLFQNNFAPNAVATHSPCHLPPPTLASNQKMGGAEISPLHWWSSSKRETRVSFIHPSSFNASIPALETCLSLSRGSKSSRGQLSCP